MTERTLRILAALLLIAAGAFAYLNSLSAPFAFDDLDGIVNNPLLYHLPPGMKVWTGPRPVVDFTFALNYAAGQTRVASYHAVNMLIHLLAGLTLFAILRRTLARSAVAAARATFLAFAIALLWLVHPLNTESVTYISQRAESLMGLFFLLTLYCAIRGWEAAGDKHVRAVRNDAGIAAEGGCATHNGDTAGGGPAKEGEESFGGASTLGNPSRRAHGSAATLWFALSFACCLLGMGCKQVMVTAPLIVLLYERTFVTNSWREILHRRWGFYLALALTMLVALRWAMPGMATTAGFAVKGGYTPGEYALSQPGVILRYLRLSFWPSPLVLDYRWPVARGAAILPPLLTIGVLLAATLVLLWRKPRWGFWAAWFFLILAPTSSLMPIMDLYFEHRMYLPLIGVIALVVLAANALVQRVIERRRESGADNPVCASMSPARTGSPLWIGLVLLAPCAVALGAATIHRNETYGSALTMWQAVVDKRPDNARARMNLGNALLSEKRYDEACVQLAEAFRLSPKEPMLALVIGNAYLLQGQKEPAADFFQRSVEHDPKPEGALNNLGLLLMEQGRLDEARDYFQRAVARRPDLRVYHYNLGTALWRSGQIDGAIREFQECVRLDPAHGKSRERLEQLQSIRRTQGR